MFRISFQKIIKAFSLIELMISLITISCIVAAFTPVITKKLSSSSTGFGGSFKEVTTQCEKFGSDCSLCYPDKCIVCTKICSSTQYKDSKKCECKECSEIEGCLACNSTKCTKCKSGYGYSSSDFKCTKCSKGYYSDGTEECKPCPKGQYQPNEGSESCLKALQGQYVPIEGAISPTPCPKGQYQPNEGRESCILCSEGQYQDEQGQASCKSCEAGYYCNSEGMENMTPCPKGTYSPTTNAKESSVCTDCPEGKYAANQGSSSCTNCEGGKWSGIGYSTCSLTCSAGYACLNGIKTKCPINTYSTSGSSSCSPCASGKYSFSGSSTCLSCSSKISNCTSCSANSDGTVTCNACSGDLTPTKTGCIKVFTSQEWSDTRENGKLTNISLGEGVIFSSWTVPQGVTKIRLTLVGASNKLRKSTDFSQSTEKEFYDSTVIDLNSEEYSWMKKSVVKLKVKGADGTAGTGATFPGGVLTEQYSTTGGKGGGYKYPVLNDYIIPDNVNSLKIVVGKAGEGSPGEPGISNGTISGGSGGAGGGASYISDGTNIILAAAGSGGGGGASACSADGSFVATGGAGGKGASIGNLEGGAGGAQNSSCIAGTHDGNKGAKGKYTSTDATSGSDSVDGFVVIRQEFYKENSPGNSGKCYYNSSIDVTPGKRYSLWVQNAGIAGSTTYATKITIDGVDYSSNMGTYQNMASGDTPGAGFSGRCQPGPYGAGAKKEPAGYYQYVYGTGGYILIENATEY